MLAGSDGLDEPGRAGDWGLPRVRAGGGGGWRSGLLLLEDPPQEEYP